jgi:ParB-like chromosome segregation protein Spo0J
LATPPKRTKLPITEVIPNPRNDRVHSRQQLDMLKLSIEKFGQPRPVLCRKANQMLIAGHGIHTAMVELGHAEIDCLLWDVDQPTADQYLVADNRFGELSHSHEGRRRELLASFDDNEFAALGFLPADLTKLFADDNDAIDVREIDASPAEDRFWITIHGPLVHQAHALQRLQELMTGLEGVDVTLGTITL